MTKHDKTMKKEPNHLHYSKTVKLHFLVKLTQVLEHSWTKTIFFSIFSSTGMFQLVVPLPPSAKPLACLDPVVPPRSAAAPGGDVHGPVLGDKSGRPLKHPVLIMGRGFLQGYARIHLRMAWYIYGCIYIYIYTHLLEGLGVYSQGILAESWKFTNLKIAETFSHLNMIPRIRFPSFQCGVLSPNIP